MKGFKLSRLIKYAVEQDSEVSKDLAIIAVRYSDDSETLKLAQSLMTEYIEIDLAELESLVNPDKFDFKKVDVNVGVDLDE